MGYMKTLRTFEDSEPINIIYHDSLGFEGYVNELVRCNKAVVAGRLNTCTTYYTMNRDTGEEIPFLKLMDN